MWAELDIHGLSKPTLCLIFVAIVPINLAWEEFALSNTCRRRATLPPESLRKQNSSAWVKKLDQAHLRLSRTEHEGINHTHTHILPRFTHFYRGTFILCYVECGAEFIAFSSRLDSWQSAWLGQSLCLVQSCACKSMTECITANHRESLSEWQLSCDDAVMARRQMEEKAANAKEMSWTKISYTPSSYALGETCLQEWWCMNQNWTWLEAHSIITSCRIWARLWIITSSEANAL